MPTDSEASKGWEASFEEDLTAGFLPDPTSPEASQGPHSTAEAERAFEGTLEKRGIVEIAQLLHDSRRSGVLVLSGKGAQGCVFFQRGEIVAASSGPLRGAIALRRLFESDCRHFRFEAHALDPERNIKYSTPVLLRAARAGLGKAAFDAELRSATGVRPAMRKAIGGIGAFARRGTEMGRDVAERLAERLTQAVRLREDIRWPEQFKRLRPRLAVFGSELRLRPAAALLIVAVVLLVTGLSVGISRYAGSAARLTGRSAEGVETAEYARLKRKQAETRAKLARLEGLVSELSGSIVTSGVSEGGPADSLSPDSASVPPESRLVAPDSALPLVRPSAGEAPADREVKPPQSAYLRERPLALRESGPGLAEDALDVRALQAPETRPSLLSLRRPREVRALVNSESGQLEIIPAWTGGGETGGRASVAVLVDAAGAVQTRDW